MEEIVEFYITCNPPLLHNGVSQMIAYATDEFIQPGKAFEILYDPEVPWFKIIAHRQYQGEIKTWFESRLERLLELKTGLVDTDSDDEFEDEDDSDSQRLDVCGHLEDPQIVPWALYQSKDYTGATDYDGCRYPDTVGKYQHKCVWRGLEPMDGFDVEKLLLRFDFLWPGLDITGSLKVLASAAKCEITYNLKGSLVYIGSDQDEDCVRKAVSKLENLKEVLMAGSPRYAHLIFVGGRSDSFQIFQCYLTNLGLYNQTYVDPRHVDPQNEYQQLQSATSLRVQMQDAPNRWIADRTTYVPDTHSSENTWKSFSAFAGYLYQTRQSGADVPRKGRASQSAQQAVPHSNPNMTTTESLSLEAAIPTIPLSGSLELQFVGTQVQKETNFPPHEPVSRTDGIVMATEGANESDRVEAIEMPRADLNHPGFEEISATLGVHSAAADAIDTWIATLEQSYSPEEVSGISNLTSAEGSTTLNEFDNMVLENLFLDESQGLSTQGGRTSRAEELESHGLLVDIDSVPQIPNIPSSPVGFENLLDQHSPQRGFHGMSAAMYPSVGNEPDGTADAIREHVAADEQIQDGDLIDLVETRIPTPDLTSRIGSTNHMRTPARSSGPSHLEHEEQTPGQATIVFNRGKTEPKETHYAMRQRAPKPGSWAQVAAKAKPRDLDHAQLGDFGPNIKVTYAQQPGPKTQGAGRVDQASGLRGVRQTQGDSPQKASTEAGTSGLPKSKSEMSNVPIRLMPQDSRTAIPGGRDNASAASPSQAVPGMDTPIETNQARKKTRPTGQKKVLKEAKAIIQHFMSSLRVTPGLVRIEAKFGRAGLKGMQNSVVGPGKAWSVAEISQQLTERGFGENELGFYTILTTNGAEADLLPRSTGLRGGGWKLSERKVYYDIFCMHQAEIPHFTIEVDAETFEHRCQSTRQELSELVIHCPQRAWDVKISLSRDIDNVSEDFVQFAASAVASLRISRAAENEVLIKAMQSESRGYHISGMNIRHVAKYGNGIDGSCLAVTMTRSVQRDIGAGKKSEYCGSTRQDASPGKPPTRWFEASVTSTGIEAVLKENAELELGDAASWNPEQMDDMIEEIVDPALRMVIQMDGVGCTNQNGHGLRLNQAFYDPLAMETAQDNDDEYW